MASYPPIDSAQEVIISTPTIKLWPQVLSALAATFGGLIMGTAIGWSGPALHLLRPNESDHSQDVFPITDGEANFIASLMPAGALVGGICGGALVGKFGRKGCMMGNSVLFALSYLCLVCANNIWIILIGRFFSGIASGITTIAAPTYVSEIASPNVRGMLGSCFQLMVTIGVLYVGIVGAFVSWQWLSVACLALALIWGLLMLLCPESPTYLLSKNQLEAARNALVYLRGRDDIDQELNEMEEEMEETNSKTFHWTMLLQKENAKPLSVALMLMIGQQFSGVNAVIFFSVTIFNAAHTTLNSLIENVIVGGVQVGATALAALLIDRLGRRILLILSSVFMIISLYSLGLFFWLSENQPDLAANLGFIPLSSLCLFIFAFSIGFGPIPWLMMSEIFSPDVKGVTTSISASFNWSLAFVVTQFFVPITKALGSAGTFWIFASALFVVLTFTVFYIPETKGKSLAEIQQFFRGAPQQEDSDENPILDNNVEGDIQAEIQAEINIVRT